MTIYYDYHVSPHLAEQWMENGEPVSEYQVDENTFGLTFSNGTKAEYDVMLTAADGVAVTGVLFSAEDGTPLFEMRGLSIPLAENSTESDFWGALAGEAVEVSLTPGDDLLIITPEQQGAPDYSAEAASFLLDAEEGYDVIRYQGVNLFNSILLSSLEIADYNYTRDALMVTFDDGTEMTLSFESGELVIEGEDNSGGNTNITIGPDSSRIYQESGTGEVFEVVGFEAIVYDDFLFPLTLDGMVMVVDSSTAVEYEFGRVLEQLQVDEAWSYSGLLEDRTELPEWLSLNPDSGLLSGTPDSASYGVYPVELMATSDSGQTIASQVLLVVDNVEFTDDPLNGLLAIRNGQESARWNFPAAVGSTRDNPAAIGTGVELSYSFLSVAPSYYDVDPVSDFQSFNESQKVATRAVLEYFSDVVDVTFVEVESGEGQITFGLSEQGDSTAGHAYYPNFTYFYNQDNTITSVEEGLRGGDVWLNASPQLGWDSSDFLPGEEGYSTLIHEIGHALGLKHPFDERYQLSADLDHSGYTVMAYQLAPSSTVIEVEGDQYNYSWVSSSIPNQSLMVGDIVALQHLYGANTDATSGDDQYSWETSAIFLETVWDSGGEDTLDCSNQIFNCEIDLTPGSQSSIGLRTTDAEIRSGLSLPDWFDQPLPDDIYNGSHNLSIAEGVVIEAAIGGSGDDRMIGNSADNRLDGGEGNDTVIYEHSFAEYSFNPLSEGWSVVHALDGSDTLLRVESLQFSDQTVQVSQLQAEVVGLDGAVTHWKSGLALEGVAVTWSENNQSSTEVTTTDQTGYYQFSDADRVLGGTLTAEKTVTDGSEVNLQDAILILKQIVGLESFNGYQTIAADFNQDGSANLADAISVLKHVVDLPTTPPQWSFIYGDTTTAADEIAVVANTTGAVELIGVLLGDVDGSWNGESV